MVGIPHPKWGERPLLVVVPQPQFAPGETCCCHHQFLQNMHCSVTGTQMLASICSLCWRAHATQMHSAPDAVHGIQR